jgi:hypothetical protein
MSKKIFINNLNTFVSKQLLEELRNDSPGEDGEPNADPNIIFGTYIDKDSSEKPTGVKKMLKVSGPNNYYLFKIWLILDIITFYLNIIEVQA